MQNKEVERLHALGFALHWIKPKSKMPVESGWTTGPRKNLKELTRAYKKGFNIGVRLGAASKLSDGTHLGVIDCDIKSTDQKHVKEMLERLEDLWVDGPIVFSGRNNGSRHVYVRSMEPLSPRRVAQATTKVLVLMPSVKPSKWEKENLTEKQLTQGLRLRPAWEIAIMGEGQQVVLPPSIHPDTGKPYSWFKNFKTLNEIGKFKDVGAVKIDADIREAIQDIKIEEVDLRASKLSTKIINMITTGDGVEDRSAALFKVTQVMVNSGFKDAEILSVLSDKSTFLGSAAFEHAKTNSRKRAAEWLQKYTIRKVRKTLSAKAAFKDLAEVDDTEVEREPIERTDWRSKIKKTQKGDIKAGFGNIKLILNEFMKEKESWPFLQHDEFAIRDSWLKDCPWRSKKDKPLADIDAIRIKTWLVDTFSGLEVNKNEIIDVTLSIADKNRVHPVRDYLNDLKWDGKPRLDSWLIDYLDCREAPKGYVSAIGTKTLVAAVARIFQPGCKFDQVLILEGKQDVGKSTAARILGGEWFADTKLNMNDKDAVVNMQGIWIYELGELSALSKAEINTVKEFISRQTDKIRMPYGRLSGELPRQGIFIGTTNNDDYLKDRTGNRRYWPVKVGDVRLDALRADRDQLWAEAVERYKEGEKLYIDDPDLKRIERSEQAKRMEHDSMDEALDDFLKRTDHQDFNPKIFKMHELIAAAMDAGVKSIARSDKNTEMRVAQTLKSLKYVRTHRTYHKGTKANWWKKVEEPG